MMEIQFFKNVCFSNQDSRVNPLPKQVNKGALNSFHFRSIELALFARDKCLELKRQATGKLAVSSLN